MKEFLLKWRGIAKRYGVIVLLLLLAVIEVLSLVSLHSASVDSQMGETSKNALEGALSPPEPPLRISEIRSPQIDFEAAMVVVEDDGLVSAVSEELCSTLPTELWIFLLFAYIALLVYNFSFTFKKVITPQWFWEVLYTALALLAWFVFDGCREELWFPFTVVKAGLIIFILYVYLLERKQHVDATHAQ